MDSKTLKVYIKIAAGLLLSFLVPGGGITYLLDEMSTEVLLPFIEETLPPIKETPLVKQPLPVFKGDPLLGKEGLPSSLKKKGLPSSLKIHAARPLNLSVIKVDLSIKPTEFGYNLKKVQLFFLVVYKEPVLAFLFDFVRFIYG